MLTASHTVHRTPARHPVSATLRLELSADKGPKHCAYESAAYAPGRRAQDRLRQLDRKR